MPVNDPVLAARPKEVNRRQDRLVALSRLKARPTRLPICRLATSERSRKSRPRETAIDAVPRMHSVGTVRSPIQRPPVRRPG